MADERLGAGHQDGGCHGTSSTAARWQSTAGKAGGRLWQQISAMDEIAADLPSKRKRSKDPNAIEALRQMAAFRLDHISRRLAKRVLYRPQIKATTAATIEKLLLYAANLLVLLYALRMINIPLAALAFIGGAVATGIGFGAQNLINNFISGFIIMGKQPISIGDLIEIDGVLGKIEEIGARCTQIRSGDNIHILVPNSSFLEKNITNWTLSDLIVRAHVTVGVIYGSPVEQVRQLLLQACHQLCNIRKDPEPFVLFNDFGDNALIFEVHFWISVQRIIERRMLESNLRFIIDERFRKANIVIALPQRDVLLDSVEPLKIRLIPADGTDIQKSAE